jgi:hypothetical protein
VAQCTYLFTILQINLLFFSGLIPSNYIEMRPHSWYYGRITRADAEKLLMNKVLIWIFDFFSKNQFELKQDFSHVNAWVTLLVYKIEP